MLATLLLVLGLQAPTLLPGNVREASATYPCARPAAVLRFFLLENDEPELAQARPALQELGAEIVYGPRTSPGRPGKSFFALSAPAGVEAKKLAAALKKAGGGVELLAATAFDGRTGQDHDFGLGDLGVTKRDFVMGLSGDVGWYDARGTWSQFFGPSGKLEPAELAKRYAKLYEPYGGARLGEVVKERFVWTLTSAPDDKRRARVLNRLEKLRMLEGAVIEGAQLTATVRLEGLESCGLAGKLPVDGEPLDEATLEAPRIAFDTTLVYEALAAEGLVP